MPTCPKCREEYRAGIARCSDCDVELVAEIAAPSDLILIFPAPQAEPVLRALEGAGIATRGATVRPEDGEPIEVRFSTQDLDGAWRILRRFQRLEVPASAEPRWVTLLRCEIGRAEALRGALEAAGIPAQEPDEDVNTLDPLERATAEILVPEEDLAGAQEVLRGMDRIEGDQDPEPQGAR